MATQPSDRRNAKHAIRTSNKAPVLVNRGNKRTFDEIAPHHVAIKHGSNRFWQQSGYCGVSWDIWNPWQPRQKHW